MRILAGTSGYSYKEWKGTFYPEDLSAKRMLGYYAERLPAVEINNTFYKMPNATTLEQWRTEVPASFTFVLKASQRITHVRRLANAESELAYFLETARALGPQLGPILFQLPPNLKKDVPRLAAFLELLRGKDVRAAFEFRHASWFENDELYDALAHGQASLCIADSEDLETPLRATASWGYLRLRREDYDEAAVARWARSVREQSWTEAFVFFKHEDAGTGPRLAKQFLELI